MLRLPSCPVLLVLALPLLAAPAHGQVRIGIDNDLFGLRGADAAPPDHEYTHGTSVSWDGRGGTRWELGQRIYTPRRDGAEPVPGERPYAGWLYGAWERAAGSERARSLLRLEAGVTGRPSLAEPVQNGLHRLAGYTPQLGWKHQLGFEPALAFSFAREHRVRVAGQGRRTLEVLPGWDASAGTLRTAAGAGVHARLGFGAGDAWTGSGAPAGWSGWMEAGGRQEAVARDLFLDGNTFGGRETGVVKRAWVAQGEAAFGVRRGRAELEYRFVLRGREYETQDEPHPYGSIRLRVFR